MVYRDPLEVDSAEANFTLASAASYRCKRALDLVVSLIALPFILLILIPAVLAIKLTSRGPILFCQTRYGQNKEAFTIFKLRSMTVCEDGAAFQQARKDDVRVTPVGRFVRATSIDELPQVFNVLRGDMSLVGPRPHPIKLDDDFSTKIANYDGRFAARPGITGLAQVRGQRGPTETTQIMRARVESDLEYVRTASVWMDLRILFGTVWVVLTSRNAF